MRLGESNRSIAKAGLMGRKKASKRDQAIEIGLEMSTEQVG